MYEILTCQRCGAAVVTGDPGAYVEPVGENEEDWSVYCAKCVEERADE